MPTLYEFLKFLHVLLAIVAIGFNASYGIWIARAARQPEHQPFALRGVKLLDDRFANPAYGLLLVTGLLLLWVGRIPPSTLWIALSLGLYGVLLVGGAGVYTPILKRQIAALDSEGPASEAFRRLSKRGMVVGIVLAAIVVAIVFLMVTKPTL